MIEMKNSAGVATLAELPKLYNFAEQKFQTDLKFNRESEQTERRKRHFIFRCLIILLRGGRFERKDGFCNLVFDLPKLNFSQNFGRLEPDELYKLGVCWIPNSIFNALVCRELAKHFGNLSVCGCFLKIGDVWRLDIDDYLSRKGLFLPVRSRQDGFIYGLKAFRYPDDQKPFLLKIRGVGKYE